MIGVPSHNLLRCTMEYLTPKPGQTYFIPLITTNLRFYLNFRVKMVTQNLIYKLKHVLTVSSLLLSSRMLIFVISLSDNNFRT